MARLGKGRGDDAVGVGLEFRISELIARKLERALRPLEAAFGLILRGLLAIVVGDRGIAASFQGSEALLIGRGLRQIRRGGAEFGLRALHLQLQVLRIEPATTSPACTRSPTLTTRVVILPATRKPRSVS